MTALLLTASLQALLTPEDAVLSDELNHASIIDGIRLCKAHKYRYRHLDVADLEAKLQEAQVGQGLVVPGAWTGLSLHLPPPQTQSFFLLHDAALSLNKPLCVEAPAWHHKGGMCLWVELTPPHSALWERRLSLLTAQC